MMSLLRVVVDEALPRWLTDGHFTFLGYRNDDIVRDGEQRALKAVLASGLGVLRQDSLNVRNPALLAGAPTR